MVRREMNEEFPTNLSDFLNHPLFVLSRHIKATECVHPTKKANGDSTAIGTYKKDLVYPRALVCPLYTRENWKRKGRFVSESERALKSSKSKTEAMPLFGEWQTISWPQLVLDDDDEIPRNAFGNIEVFHPAMMPFGCIILPLATSRTATRMEIDNVKAVIGFNHGRNSTPIYGGIGTDGY